MFGTSNYGSRLSQISRAAWSMDRTLADLFGTLLAADNEKVAWSNSRAGEVILRFERLERDAKAF